MTRVLLSMTALLVMSLACSQAGAAPTPTPSLPPASPTPSAVPTDTPRATEAAVNTVTIRAVVYVRQMPDASSAAVGSLETGELVPVVACEGEWCEIEGGGFVFRGCTDDNPDGLKCEAK
jgi:uncharacterized protein YgiM (DUF1202 family)